jgi:hypothetical protein
LRLVFDYRIGGHLGGFLGNDRFFTDQFSGSITYAFFNFIDINLFNKGLTDSLF